MPYSREQSQVHQSICKAGNNSKLTILAPSGTDPMTGISTGESDSVVVNFVQVAYSTKELSDNGISNGLTKLLISPIGEDGEEISDFSKLLKNKKASVKYPSGRKVGIKLVNITVPDGITPIVARVFIGG